MKALKLSVAAVAALAVTAFAADTDVLKPYGVINGEIGVYGVDGGKGKLETPVLAKSYSSRFGLTGAHALDGGLTAVYQVEVGFNPANGGNNIPGATADTGAATPLTGEGQKDNGGELGNRNSFVGLAGGFGTFLIGNHDTPYKLAARGAGAISSADSVAELKLNTDRRLQGAVAYVAPKDAIGGATLALAVVPVSSASGSKFRLEFNDGTDANLTSDKYRSGFHYSIGAVVPLEEVGLKIGLGYESAWVPVVDETITSLFGGLTYTLKDTFSVGLFYEQIKASGALEDSGNNAILVPVTAWFGDGLFLNVAFKLTNFEESAQNSLNGFNNSVGLVDPDEAATQISAQIGKNWGKDFTAYFGVKNSSFKNKVIVDKKSATELGAGIKVSFN